MTTTANTTRSDAKLKKQIAAQGEQIGNLRTRISELMDRMTILQSDLDGFKKNVSKDLLEVVDHLKKNK